MTSNTPSYARRYTNMAAADAEYNESESQYRKQMQQRAARYATAQTLAQQASGVPALNPDGTPADIGNAFRAVVGQLTNDPNSVSLQYVEQALRSNPFIVQMYSSGLEANLPSFSQLAQDINQRAIAKSQHRDVYNPNYDETSPVDEVKPANREENISPWKKILLNTLQNLNLYNPTRDVEAELRREDEAISAIPMASQHSIRKLQTLRYAYIELDNLRRASRQAVSKQELNDIQDRMLAQQHKIQALEDMITPQDEANIEQYGEQYFDHLRRREELKGAQEALTPRYQSTVDREMMNAELKREYLARGESASFTDPKSFTNGYALSWVYNNFNWETMTNEVAPEVLPWVAIAMAKDAALFAATGGVGTPYILANIAADLGLAANSAMAAIDKNVDAYFEQHGTTAGFSELKSHVMEGIAYLLDMYGSKLVAGGLPAAADKVLQGIRSKVMHTAQDVYEKGAEIAAKTGSTEPIKAALKQIYNTVTLSSITQELGKALVEAGEKSAIRYGGSAGMVAKGLGNLIKGTEAVWTSGIKNPALGLALENVMSETARQVGRQNGMNPEAIAESGMEGLLAGPIGRVGGVIGGGAKAIVKDYIQEPLEDRGNRYANTRLEMRKIKEGINNIMKGGSLSSRVDAINEVTEHINDLEQRLEGTTKSKYLTDLRNKIKNKYAKFFSMAADDATTLPEVQDIVNQIGKEEASKKENVKQLKAYSKDLEAFKRREKDVEGADELIKSQIEELKNMRSKMSGDVSKDSAAFYNLSENAQKAYLTEELGYSDSVAKDIIEDSKKKMSIKDVSSKAVNRIRNVFGYTAPAVVKQALDTLGKLKINKLKDIGKHIAEKLNSPVTNYSNLTAELDTAISSFTDMTKDAEFTPSEIQNELNALHEARNSLNSVFGKSAERIAQYQNAIKDKEITSDVSIDELSALSEDFRKADPATQAEVLDYIHKNPDLTQINTVGTDAATAVQNALEKKAGMEGAAEKGEEGHSPASLLNDVLAKMYQHNKKVTADKNSTGTEEDTSEVHSTDAGEMDKETHARFAWKHTQTGSPYSYMQKAAQTQTTTELSYQAMELSKKENAPDHVAKMDAAFRDRRKLKNAIKRVNKDKAPDEQIKPEDVSFTKLDTLIKKGLDRELVLSEVRGTLAYLTKFEGVKEKHAEEAAAHSNTQYGGRSKVSRKSGHKTETEKRNEALTEKTNKEAAKALTEASSEVKQFKKDLADANAEFLLDWESTDLVKFIAYIHNKHFLNFSPYSDTPSVKDLIAQIESGEWLKKNAQKDRRAFLEAFINALSTAKNKATHPLFEFKEDGTPVISQRTLGQLTVLANVLRMRAEANKEQDLEAYAKLFNQLHDLLVAAKNENLLAVDETSRRGLWADITKTAYKEVFADDQQRRELWTRYLKPDSFITLVSKVEAVMTHFTIASTLADLENTSDLDITRMRKDTSGRIWQYFAQLKGTRLANLMDEVIDDAHLDEIKDLFGLINEKSEVWTWVNEAWGWKDPSKDITENKSFRDELAHHADAEIAEFFKLDTQDPSFSRTQEQWVERWKNTDKTIQRKIAAVLLSNKYVLAKLFKAVVSEDKDKANLTDANRADTLSGFNFKTITTLKDVEDVLDKLKAAFPKEGRVDKSDLNLATKILLVNQLFAANLITAKLAAEYQLKHILNPNNKDSVARIFFSLIKDSRTRDINDVWGRLAVIANGLCKIPKLAEYIEKVKTNPLGITGVLPTAKQLAQACRGENLQFLDQIEGLRDKNFDEKLRYLQANFGTLAALAAVMSLVSLDINYADANLGKDTIPANETVEAFGQRDFTGGKFPDTVTVNLTLETKDGATTLLTTLSSIFSYVQTGVNKFNTVKPESDSVNYNDFTRLTQAISDSNHSVSKEDANAIKSHIDASGERDTKDNIAIDNYLAALQKGEYFLADNMSDGTKTAIAKALAWYINRVNSAAQGVVDEQIHNAYKTESKEAIEDLDISRKSDLKPAKAHEVSEMGRGNNEAKVFVAPKRSVFFVNNGLNQFLGMNPGLINNSFINLLNKVVSKLNGNVVKFNDFIGASEFDYKGDVYRHTLQVAATVSLSMLPRLSMDTNPDYIQMLAAEYTPQIAAVFADPSRHFVDLSTTAYSMGATVARVLGYNRHSPVFDTAARRLGTLAVLTLIDAGVGVEAKWITRDGQILDSTSSGEEKALACPVLEITDEAENFKDTIRQSTEFNVGGIRSNLAEKLLGTELFVNEEAYTTPERLYNLNAFIEEYADYHLNGNLYEARQNVEKEKPFDTTDAEKPLLNVAAFEKTFCDAKSIDIYSELDPNTVVGKCYRVGDYAVVAWRTNNKGQLDTWLDSDKAPDKVRYMVYHHKSVVKSDLTLVAPYRLLTTALNMSQGVKTYKDTLRQLFTSLIRYDSHGEVHLKYSYEEACTMTPDELDALCRKPLMDKGKPVLDKDGNQEYYLTDLGVLIYENSRYGSNPNARGGSTKLNKQRANLEDFKRLVRDAKKLLDAGAFKEDKTFYFNELNTVNNRLYVDSLIFNYREYKHYRYVTDVNGVRNINFNTGAFDETQATLLIVPLLSSLGFDVDKQQTLKDVQNIFMQLIGDSSFKKILEDLVKNGVGTDVSKQNGGDSDVQLVINAITKHKLNFKYDTYKGKPDKADAKIKVNVESVTALINLCQAEVIMPDNSTASLAQWLLDSVIPMDAKRAPNFTFTGTFVKALGTTQAMTGIQMYTEYDGLTNGPSFKNIISKLTSNTDTFSKMYLGAVGISSDFDNIIAGYKEWGVRDTYLYNGDISKTQLVYNALMQFQDNNMDMADSFGYMNSLYSAETKIEGTKATDGKDTIEYRLPGDFLDTFMHALDNILNRDFMKPLVMVIGYEAGKASVVLTAILNLDEAFDKMCARGNANALENWLNSTRRIIGNSGTLKLEYLHQNSIREVTLDLSTGTFTCDAWGGAKQISQLTPDNIRRLSIKHSANARLYNSMSNVFSQMYDAIAKNKEIVQTPFKVLTESSQVLCNVLNTFLGKALQAAADKSDANGDYILSADFIPKLVKISEQVRNAFNTVMRTGLEVNPENKADLDLTKEEMDSLIGEAISSYTVTKNGKVYVRVKNGIGAKESRGAGVVPLSIHTLDSSVMHLIMAKIQRAIGRRILTVHDAVLVSPLLDLAEKDTPTLDSTLGEKADNKASQSVLKANKEHYGAQVGMLEAFADYMNNIFRALDGISALRNDPDHFGFALSNDEALQLIKQVQGNAHDLYSQIIQLVTLKEEWFAKQSQLPEVQRTKDGQYAGTAGIGTYTPSNADLSKLVLRLQDLKQRLKDSVPIFRYKDTVVSAIIEFINTHVPDEQKLPAKNAILNPQQKNIRDSIWRNATDINSLIEAIQEATSAISNPKDLKDFIFDHIRNCENTSIQHRVEEAVLKAFTATVDKTDLNKEMSLAQPKTTDFSTVENSVDRKNEAENVTSMVEQIIHLSDKIKDMFFHIDRESSLQKARVEALSTLRTMRTGILGVLTNLRNMTGLNKLSSDNFSNFLAIADVLINSFGVTKLDVDDTDIPADGVNTEVFLSDSDNYSKVMAHARQAQINENLQLDYNTQKQLFAYYSRLMRDFEHYAYRDVHLVFTLRSEGDILHLLALQALKNDANVGKKYKNVHVHILPAISNLTSNSPAVDKEVAILQVLKDQYSQLGVTYVSSMTLSHNVELFSRVMCKRLNTAFTEQEIATGKQTMLGLREVNVGYGKDTKGTMYSGYKTIDLTESANRFSNRTVIRKDDSGRYIALPHKYINVEGERSEEEPYSPNDTVFDTDLYTSPKQGDIPFAYDEAVYRDGYMPDTDKIQRFKSTDNIGDPRSAFEDVLGTDSTTAVIVETTADTEIRLLANGFEEYSKEFPEIQEAIARANKIKQQREWEYQHSIGQDIEFWRRRNRPIVVSVPSDNFTDKYFIFLTSIDNSIDASEFIESIQNKDTDPATMGQAKVKASTRLDTMLSQGAKDDKRVIHALAKRKEAAIAERRNAKVIIDERYIEPNLKYDTSILAEDLDARNGYFLSVIAPELIARGVKNFSLPVQYTNRYFQLQGEGRSTPYIGTIMQDADTGTTTTMFNMGLLPKGRLGQLAASMRDMKRYDKMSLASEKAQIRFYRGRVSEAAAEQNADVDFLASHTAIGSHINGKDGQQVFNALLDDFIASDEARGVDTSLIKESRSLLSGLLTITGVYLFDSPAGVEASKTYLSRVDQATEHNVVLLGRARGTQSMAEAFLHEMFHTIWVHIGVSNPALKKKLTDMYNFVHRNLTYADFKEGQNYTTEAIMDAVFHEETTDNVEEFLCYYMTNRSFRDAVDHMANRKGKNIQEVLQANTKGFFRKLLDTVRNFFAKQEVSDTAARSIYNLCKQAAEAAVIYNNKYWQQKINLIEDATDFTLRNLSDIEAGEGFAGYRNTSSFITERVLDKLHNSKYFDDFVHRSLVKFMNMLHNDKNIDEALGTIGTEWRFARDGFLNDLMASLEGVSKRQFDYLILRTRGKAQIDQKREQIKSVINEYVRDILKNVPEEHYEKLTMDFIRTDASCLFRNTDLTAEQVKKLITDKSARDKQIAKLEHQLQHRGDYWYLINSAKGLAQYLVTGFNPTGIGYRNVKEIMANSGALGQGIATLNGVEDNPAHILDQLTTLYAFNLKTNNTGYLAGIDSQTLADLAVVHNSIKDADNDSVYNNTIRGSMHVPKGELHTVKNKHRYEIIPQAELKAYEWTGYRKVSDAVLDPFFKSQFPDTKFVMVRAPYKSDATTTAGIFSMTNVFKGRASKGISIGTAFRTNQDEISFRRTAEYKRLRDYVTARIVALNKPNPQLLTEPTSGNMVLNFNCLDRLCGATFEVNPIESIKQRSSSQKITSMLGNIYGSILERTESPKMNEQIGQALIDIYENAPDQHLFRWIAPNSTNAEYRELYEKLPPEIKEVCKEKYGDRGVPVHNKSLNTVFGYRNMSANDTRTFIENERAKHANADKLASGFSVGIRNILYNGYLGNVEYFLKYLAHVGKDNIVIKGVTTSWYNILSNCTLLHLKGLSPKQVINYQLEGLKQFDTIRQLNYQLALLKRKQIFGQYTDADARDEAAIRKTRESLAVYNLYKEGIVMNTIAEDLTESENFTKEIVKRFTPRGPIRTIVSNLALTNDSFLYRVLADFASLGDVAGKYALYKFNKERLMSDKEALRESLQSFIDYSNPLPKQLQLVDDLAVLPFMKYGLGIQNALLKIFVNRPSRSLAWILGTNTILDWPSPFESLLTFDSISDRLQLPLEMYTDSWNVLPASRVLANLVPDD